MEIIALLYIIAALIAIAAGIPQVIQLLKVRNSDEFELGTWLIWLVSQGFSLLYVASIGNTLLTIVNVGWVSFYAVMVVLIIRFRPKAVWRFKLAQTTASVAIEHKA